MGEVNSRFLTAGSCLILAAVIALVLLNPDSVPPTAQITTGAAIGVPPDYDALRDQALAQGQDTLFIASHHSCSEVCAKLGGECATALNQQMSADPTACRRAAATACGSQEGLLLHAGGAAGATGVCAVSCERGIAMNLDSPYTDCDSTQGLEDKAKRVCGCALNL